MAAKHMNSERIFKPVATHGHSASIHTDTICQQATTGKTQKAEKPFAGKEKIVGKKICWQGFSGQAKLPGKTLCRQFYYPLR
jgi:hypothetical protein